MPGEVAVPAVSVPHRIMSQWSRRLLTALLRAAVNKAQHQQKQAIDKYNREASRHSAAVRKAVNDYNRDVRTYNAKARAYNSQVRSQRRRL